MTQRPLAGRTVVVTRARAQSAGLAARLEDLGAGVIELPVIAVDDPPDGGTALAAAAERLLVGGYGWVALTSSNAARRLLASLGDRRVPAGVRWAAVGTGTAGVLTEAGIIADLVPSVSTADSLADAFPVPVASVPGAEGGRRAPDVRVLFPRAETVSGGLAAGLRAKGWEVDEVVAYRTVAGEPSPTAVRSAGRADAVAFTSSSTVERAVELLGQGGVPPVVFTIGPLTSASARAAGLSVAAEADPHTLEGLVAAVVDVLATPAEAPPVPGSATAPGPGPGTRLP